VSLGSADVGMSTSPTGKVVGGYAADNLNDFVYYFRFRFFIVAYGDQEPLFQRTLLNSNVLVPGPNYSPVGLCFHTSNNTRSNSVVPSRHQRARTLPGLTG
jgi:hypothetical protein